MAAYTADRLSSDNALFPNRLEIDVDNITYYKGYVFGYQSKIIARTNVASISIKSGILFADVIIESIGGDKIVASGFKKSEARIILQLLAQ
ncbi:MAG: hypothetical protein LBE13_22050 [Bacteroidales bacterium]|jgi:hypothetical protein|nr:hypothetical protein [Bacteroidales bacterium]